MISHLQDIIVYPIKSLGGIHLQSAELMGGGLQGDRSYMLVDAQGKFLSQREMPGMALFSTHIKEDGTLVVEHAGEHCLIPPQCEVGELTPVSVWDRVVNVRSVARHISDFFADHLGVQCSLMSIDTDFEKSSVADSRPHLKDSAPILLVGSASLEGLNDRLENPVVMNRFRPNLVLHTSEAHEEDLLSSFMLGKTVLHVVKPCSRCVMINIDQQTGFKSNEPLKTLSTYRTSGRKVNFGMYAICWSQETRLTIGDVFTSPQL